MSAHIDSLTKAFLLNNEQLKKVSSLLLQEFNNGLNKDTHESAAVKMFPTYVFDILDGTEKGKFMALDLGGTNFRVLAVNLDGKVVKVDQKSYAVSQDLMLGTGEQLFDTIAARIADFMQELGLRKQKLSLGFTFSFPLKMESINRATLSSWTKGFNCPGVVGEDVVQLLSDAIKRRGDLNIEVLAILNDTTGTLMSCSLKHHDCRAAIIVGTGTNACYFENIKNVPLLNGKNNGSSEVLINTEWGAFGSNGCLDFVRTQWDKECDANTINAGKCAFEKMISGMYLGEVLRCLLATLTKKNLLFGGVTTTKLLTPFDFGTKCISMIDTDKSGIFTETKKVLQLFEIANASPQDIRDVQLISSRVSMRAAYLVSAAVATILNKMKRSQTVIGVDGSLYKCHPHFHDLMVKKISELTHPDYKFDLVLSEDGSGIGAALVAAFAEKHCKR